MYQTIKINAAIITYALMMQGCGNELIQNNACLEEKTHNLTNTTLTEHSGNQVRLYQEKNQWKANVTDNQGNPIATSLPVVANKKTINQLERITHDKAKSVQEKQLFQRQHIHYHRQGNKKFVQVGSNGLRGGGRFFTIDLTQIPQEDINNMRVANIALALMLPTTYRNVQEHIYTIFSSLQQPINVDEIENLLNHLLEMVRPAPLLINNAPMYLDNFRQQTPQVIATALANFLAPTDYRQTNIVQICEESCTNLMRALERIIPTTQHTPSQEDTQDANYFLQAAQCNSVAANVPQPLSYISDHIIKYTRDTETTLSTTGPFYITGTSISGFFLEPPGPATYTANLNKRIPTGIYFLEDNIIDSRGTKKGLRLYNDFLSKSRAILIHSGNGPSQTQGCLLTGKLRTTDYVGGKPKASRKQLKKILAWFRRFKDANPTIIIEENIHTPQLKK